MIEDESIELKPVLVSHPDGSKDMVYVQGKKPSIHDHVARLVPYVIVISSVLGIIVAYHNIKKMKP